MLVAGGLALGLAIEEQHLATYYVEKLKHVQIDYTVLVVLFAADYRQPVQLHEQHRGDRHPHPGRAFLDRAHWRPQPDCAAADYRAVGIVRAIPAGLHPAERHCLQHRPAQAV